ncbi:MAG TPA: hypothetical protein VHL53_07060, partial [Acidimicrobiia bacterium]|nr:hypothetical protein [Acidimicrobiia bacterium]
MSDRPMTPDVPLRRFATAWWLLLRALNQEDIVDALVNAARELTGADGAVFAHRDGDVIGALCLLHGTPVEPDQWPTEALDLLGRDAVSREVVTAPELERRAAMAAESVAEEARRLEGLPG